MNTLTIVNQEVQIKEWDGQRVVTLKDIDQVHQRPEGTARKRFNDNRKHFIEGEDFHRICASEFRTHKMGEISSKAHEDITLLTESGYLMLVKSFTDDLAWKVQRALVNSYFRAKVSAKPKRVRSKPEDVIFRQQMNIAKAFAKTTGVPLDIATATAISVIEERTGFNYDHWKLALPARSDEKQIPYLNATAVGNLVGLNPQTTNKLLEAMGFQVKEGDDWRLTEKGKEHGAEFPYTKNGHSGYQIKWRDSIVDALNDSGEVV
jgi:hypothetical protein